MKKVAQQDGLTDSLPAKALKDSLEKALGEDWASWEPETVWSELRNLGQPLSAALKDKVQALKTLLTTNAFWRDHLAFEKVVMALNGNTVIFDSYQHPSPAMIARGLLEAASIRSVEFSDEVLKYAAAVCYEAGLIVLPESLAVVQESLDELTSPILGKHLKGEISQAWSSRAVNDAPQGLYTETVVGIQLARMAAIQDYAGAA